MFGDLKSFSKKSLSSGRAQADYEFGFNSLNLGIKPGSASRNFPRVRFVMATLLMMCDRRDLGTAVGERPPSAASEIDWEDFVSGSSSESKILFEPNLYLYDAYPGGIGFSEPLYRAYGTLLHRTRELISGCGCENGCPSCVGPTADHSERTKEVVLEILGRLCGKPDSIAMMTETA